MTPNAVDVHAHAVPAGLIGDLAAGRVRFPHIAVERAGPGRALSFGGGPPTRPIAAGLTDPLESFARLYFDSVVFDPAVLEFLVAKVGQDRVLLGSDYPFPIGDLAPRDVVERAALRDGDRAKIMGGNAAGLFGQAAAGPR